MVERKIKGFFLGVPVLSQGTYTEDERLRRDGFVYAALSLQTYLSSDYIVATFLTLLCLCVTIYLNVVDRPLFKVRIAMHTTFSIGYLIDLSRSEMSGLAYPFVVALAAYYGLMYFIGFDR